MPESPGWPEIPIVIWIDEMNMGRLVGLERACLESFKTISVLFEIILNTR